MYLIYIYAIEHTGGESGIESKALKLATPHAAKQEVRLHIFIFIFIFIGIYIYVCILCI